MNGISQNRLLTLGAILFASALILIGQLVRWQVLSHFLLLQTAHSVQNQPEEIEPQRGMILDHNGHILAMNAFTYEVACTPRLVRDWDVIASRLEPWLSLSSDRLRKFVTSEATYAVLAQGLSSEAARAIEELHLGGLEVTPKAYRFYPEGSLAGHLLGFVNAKGEGFGVEKFYHEVLRGQPGQRSAAWDPVDLLRDVPPEDGADLYLTLDHVLQYQVEQELMRGVREAEAEGGTAVVMDTRTGAVLAWASYPSYDPNDFPELAFTHPQLFMDPVVSAQYEPGSVLKVLTMAAALDSGLVTPQSTIQDREAVEVGGHIIRNWDRKGHGVVSMTEVLALSLNVCTAQLSTRMGSQTFYGYMKAFGLGQKTGVDLSWEVEGRVKEPGDADWSESDLGVNSFGQGIAVTPLQLITAVAAVANEGRLMRPYVVKARAQEGQMEFTQPVMVRQVISPEAARQLTEMLVQVVQKGLSSPDLVPGYRVAGKTGTAQIPIPGGYHPQDTIASFIGYLPAEAPRVVILVKIDRPRASPWGSVVAVPVFSRIAQRTCHLLDLPPEGALLAQR